MTKVINAAVLCAAFLLSACGGGGGDSSKELFSVWTRDGSGSTLNLTGVQFSRQTPIYSIDRDGSQCNCLLTITGTQERGSIALNSCSYVRGSSQRDPGCSSRNAAGNYTNEAGVLNLSGNNGTATFR